MLNDLQFHIDRPCTENWEKMRPEGQGRFCASCQKTVVDFVSMSDRELLSWFAKPVERTCGRFQNSQLDRKLLLPRQRKNGPLGFWRYLLAAFLISSESSAQTTSADPSYGMHEASRPDPNFGQNESSRYQNPSKNNLPDTLRGRILDAENSQPISFATIMIQPKLGTSSDGDGYFSIPRSWLAQNHTLTISAVGYQSLLVDINRTWTDNYVKPILLNLSTAVLGEISVVVKRRPKKWVSLLKDSLKNATAYTGLTKKVLSVFPNPVPRGSSVTLSLRLDKPGNYLAQLFSTSGVLLESMEVAGDEKSRNILMNIPPTLVPGAYIIRLSDPAITKTYTQEILVI